MNIHMISCQYQKLTKPMKTSFLACVLFGLFTHLHIFSVNYIMLDSSTHIDGLGTTYTSGRWMLGFFETLSSWFLGIYQLPYFNGILSILLTALMAMLLVYAFEIRHCACAAFIGMMLVAFPSVAVLFAFMFAAPAYLLAQLMSLMSVYLLYRKATLFRFFFGAALMCISLGIYQAYLPLAASLALLLMILEGLRTECTVRQLARKGVLCLGMLFLGFMLYYFSNRLVLAWKHTELSSYQGLDQMGKIDFQNLPQIIKRAYSCQLRPFWYGTISGGLEVHLIRIANGAAVLLFARLLVLKKASLGKKLALTALFALLPMAYNGIYLMVPAGSPGVHPLMLSPLVFTFVLPAVLIEEQPTYPLRWQRWIAAFLAFSLWLSPIAFCYRNNTAYLHAELIQEQTTAYYASMITRIRSTEGYRDDLPVAVIGRGIHDESIAPLPMSGRIHTMIFGSPLNDILATWEWQRFCALHLGWGPTFLEEVPAEIDPALVSAMPCYPDDGSIRIVEDTILLKFSQEDS